MAAGGNHGGSARPLREGKATSFEGGVREPCIMRWPGRIPADTVCDEPVMTIDLLPTIARLAGAEVPSDRMIDGRDIWPLMAGEPEAKKSARGRSISTGSASCRRSAPGRGNCTCRTATSHPAVVDQDGGYGKQEAAAHRAGPVRSGQSIPARRPTWRPSIPTSSSGCKRVAEAARADLGDTAQKIEGGQRSPAGPHRGMSQARSWAPIPRPARICIAPITLLG